MSNSDETPRVDQIVSDHLRRTLLARDAHAYDPQYHLEVNALRRMLALADEAMEAEALPQSVRDRIIHFVLYGGLDEEQAIQRIAEQRAAVAKAKLMPARPFFVDDGAFPWKATS